MVTIYTGVIKKFAKIKLDDYNTTHSTGGVVEKVMSIGTPINDNTNTFVPIPEDYPSNSIESIFDIEGNNNYVVKECPEDCQPGWIMKDKTLEIVDSNNKE
jgi:hypothetical protein